MGCCCCGFSSSYLPQPEQPLDHRVYAESYTRQDRAKIWESIGKEGGQEIMRFNEVEDIRAYNPGGSEQWQVGVLVLTELFLCWNSTPSTGSETASQHSKATRRARIRGGSSIVIGYGMIEEVGIVCFDAGGCAVRVVAREAFGEQFEVIFRVLQPAETLPAFTTTIPEESGPEGSEAWHQMLANMMDRVLKAYNWSHYFLHCALRQRDLFEHIGVIQPEPNRLDQPGATEASRPELALLPNEEITQTFSGILNFGASQEDLVGHLIVTNCRVVWALDRDRTTYNVSVPHRAHVPSLTDTQTFGLCLVLHIPQPFLNNPDHLGGMRLGFGAAGMKDLERKQRLEQILQHIVEMQGQYWRQPKYGVADYMRNSRQYKVESNVRLLHALSHLDTLSENTRPDTIESDLQGEVSECVICLEQVCSESRLAYLLAAGKLGWACRHIFHLECAQQLATRKCPVCRSSFSEVREMPDIRHNPGAWFDAMDVDRTGDLDLDEVLGALSVVLPIDRDKLELLLRPENEAPTEAILNDTVAHESSILDSENRLRPEPAPPALPNLPSSALWRQWDKAGTGRITRKDFEAPEGGLLVWILARLKLVHRGQRPHPCLAAAASSEALGRWFDFWDWSQVGFLTRGQITRAVAREFEGRLADLKCLDLVRDVWKVTTEAFFSNFIFRGLNSADLQETMSKPVTPKSSVVTPSNVPDEEPGSPMSGHTSKHHLALAHADPWNLREGICSRGDFLEGGLGSALRLKLLEVTTQRSAAGRHRQTSREMHSMFSFEEALVSATGSTGTTRFLQSLAECAGAGKRRPPGEPEPLGARQSASALSVDASCNMCTA
ncbi:unnamed protein product [Effrenium voratum]|nr:unnamed protein product [Effrenium voratum]